MKSVGNGRQCAVQRQRAAREKAKACFNLRRALSGAMLLMAHILLLTGCARQADEAPASTRGKLIHIVVFRKGTTEQLDPQSPHFQEVQREAENLLATANSKYDLTPIQSRVQEIKRTQTALEIIYPEVQQNSIRGKTPLLFTRLLIPLSKEGGDGTVFFAGAFLHTTSGPKTYDELSDYTSINYVNNAEGVGKLRQALKQMNVKIE